MLILIAGITGMVGQPCSEATISQSHQTELSRGVDAVICAYGFLPEVSVEGQLMLLRATERAGVKIFHTASWNYDWTLGYLGQHEAYDPYLAFHTQVRISSRIKPLFMFTGRIAEWLFSNRRDKIWDRETQTLPCFWICTTASDIAAYTLEAICAPGADEGGFIRVESFRFTPTQFVEAYERARSGKVSAHLKYQGSVDDVVEMLKRARETIHPVNLEEYIG
ncbi:unnamed protein product [Penicillium manginii]